MRTPSITKLQRENNKLSQEVECLKKALKERVVISEKETALKNTCFFFLIGKGLYTEYHEWLNKRIANDVINTIKKSLL